MQTEQLKESDLTVGDNVFLILTSGEEIHAEVTFITNIGVFVRGRTNMILYHNIQQYSLNRS